MTNLSDKYTHKAVCSVCFNEHFLNPAHGGQKPIRHGFHVVGGGHVGAWHTGPCAGVGFPHFGISTEGTVWALGQIKASIETTKAAIARLETKPDLNWSYQPTKYQAATWQVRKSTRVPSGDAITRTLKPGTGPEVIEYPNPEYNSERPMWTEKVSKVTAPSYDQEYNIRMSELKSHLDSLEDDRQRYQTAIDTWKPQAAVPAKTAKVVHKLIDRRDGRTTIDCNWRTEGWKVNELIRKGQATKEADKVTCKRCKH